jgi:hypothetical protein
MLVFYPFKLMKIHLSCDEIVQEIYWWRVKEKVVGNCVVEEAWISVAKTAGSNEQRDGDRDGQIHGECIAEALDHDFAREFA